MSCRCLYSATANSRCDPSSLLMSSLLKHSPGSIPRFFSQKIAQKLPEKKMPSTHMNAIRRFAKGASDPIHVMAQSALSLTALEVSTARNSLSFSALSWTNLSIMSE